MRKKFFLCLSLFVATTANAQLSGTYTINSNASQNPDFTSFSAAASALATGVTGQVVFEVAPGTYEEYVSLNSITGAHADSRVIFRGMGDDNQQVVVTTNAGYTNNSTLTLDGTDYVTFENMTLASTSENTAIVVTLRGGLTNDRFENVRFVGCVSNASNTDNNKNLVYRVSGGWMDTDNEFVGCEFVNGFIGLYYQGSDMTQYNDGLLVENCTFTNQCSKSIYATFTDHVTLSGNTIENANDTHTDYNAIDVYRCRFGCLIENNVMNVKHPTKYVTVMKIRPCTGSATEPVIIRNNMVDLQTGASSNWCYSFDNADSEHIYFAHNTGRCSGSGSGGILFVQKDWEHFHAYNNLLVNETSGYVFRFQNNSANRFCDYNRVSFSGSSVGFMAGTSYATLETWNEATGFDTHSALCSPEFSGGNDLHVTTAEGLAVSHPLDYVTFDIDGDERGETPCAGADELQAIDLPPVVVSPMAPIVFTTFPQTLSHYVGNCFDDPDNSNELMQFEVVGCPPVVSATINAERMLVVVRNTPLAFSETFVVRANSNGKHADMDVSVSGNEVDQPPYIANPLQDVVFDQFPQTIQINLEGVASDPDDPDENITYSIVSNSNETDLVAQLDGTTLVLTRTNHHQSSASLSMSAESDGQTVGFSINVVINETPDLPPIVIQPIEDIVSEYFPETIHVNLEGVATDPDDPDENITYSIVSNSNPQALSAQITNMELVLERVTGYDATIDLALRATSNGLSVDFNAHVILLRVVDLPPFLAKPLDDVVMNSFPESILINLEGVASDPDDPDENIVYTLVSNSNPQALSAQITNKELLIERLSEEAGTAHLMIRASSNGLFVDFGLNVIINAFVNVKETRMCLSAYPNPATDWLTLELPDATCFDYEVHLSTGQRVMKGHAVGHSATIDLGTLPKGMYVVHVIAGSKRLTQTVLVH